VALGWTERDVTPDLKGALVAVPRKNFAAITEPQELAGLLRAMHAYDGHVVIMTALKCLYVRANYGPLNGSNSIWMLPNGVSPQ